MSGNRRRAGPVEPELAPRFGGYGDEAFGTTGIGDAHDARRGIAHGGFIVASEIGQQHHLGPHPALGLGGVADRLYIALIEMFEAREHGARVLVHHRLDLDDRRDGVAYLAEELEAHGADVTRHPMQDEGGAGDEPVATLLLNPWQPGQKLVGHILAQTLFAEATTRNVEHARVTVRGDAIVPIALHRKAGTVGVVDLAQVVSDPGDLHRTTVGVDHPPGGEVVDGRSPQHGLFAAGIHCDIAADAGGIGRGRIDREHQASGFRCLHHPTGHYTRPATDDVDRLGDTRQCNAFRRAELFQLLGVDDHGVARQRNGATGVAGTAAARDDGQAQFDAGADQRCDLLFAVGIKHDERILHAPVGGIGHVGNPCQPVERDVAATGVAPEVFQRLAPQSERLVETAREGRDGGRRGGQQCNHTLVVGVAPDLDLVQPVSQRLDQRQAALAVGQQVILEIRVAADHPDIAEHFVEHARGAAGASLAAQLVEQLPAVRAEQPDHDLAIGERGVVVWDFA